MRPLLYGDRALLIECVDPEQVAALHAEIRRRRAAGLLLRFDDLVPAELTLLIDGLDDPAAFAADLAEWELEPVSPVQQGNPPAAVLSVPVVYDGADLEYVADLWQISPAEAISVHSGFEYLVAFCGFAPGFAYLTGLPQQYQLPRRTTPRTAVPAGSVAVAGPYTGVYPQPSPGGWHLLGRTDAPLWDLGRPEPALLAPGTRVRFQVRES
ncbi:MAG TPA: allophanate hydrolase subunit 1 [Actinocrinis sp.]|nr:allophanate hydrolase subunit 1 [Actinocrinis sp.]